MIWYDLVFFGMIWYATLRYLSTFIFFDLDTIRYKNLSSNQKNKKNMKKIRILSIGKIQTTEYYQIEPLLK